MKAEKERRNFLLEKEVIQLIEEIARKEKRTKSGLVELAVQQYAARNAATN